MLATALSATLIGLDAYPVRVEVEAVRGVPSFELVGLAETSVRESRVRVRSALGQIGVDLCDCRIVVNLAPADIKKGGGGFDLAIAAATLGALRRVPQECLEGVLFLGELSLTGTLQPLRGVLPHLLSARIRGVRQVLVPEANGPEASLVDGLDVRTLVSLPLLLQALRGELQLPKATRPEGGLSPDVCDDLEDVRGQFSARRALEVAAAGRHNLLMIGPPGAGKTMLARRLPGILPPIASEEALEVTAIHSISGLLNPAQGLSRVRPFRAPHHTISEAALVGGGDIPRPGEVTLAHHGVLFLDELAEFRRSALEALRQPLEDGVITVARSQARITFPAKPLLACAMNPCPCGYLGDGSDRCVCSHDRIKAYCGRLSGPLIDRIDVHVRLPPVNISSLQANRGGESSVHVQERVAQAHAIQRSRKAAGEVDALCNGFLSLRELDRVAALCDKGKQLLSAAVAQLSLSARAYSKVLRVARTLADLEGVTEVKAAHVAEAIGFRILDKGALSPSKLVRSSIRELHEENTSQ